MNIIKKARVSKENFPTLNSDVGGYLVRYRIVSDDRNRVSHWSPFYTVYPNILIYSRQLAVFQQGQVIAATWDLAKVKENIGGDYLDDSDLLFKVETYDVWIRWANSGVGDWRYLNRISGNSFSEIIPSYYYDNGVKVEASPTEVTIEVRLSVDPPTRENAAHLIYVSDTVSI